jgi:hypothetical protein
LEADWVYFDGAEVLYEKNGRFVDSLDWYFNSRITRAIMEEFKKQGVIPLIHQQSSSGSSTYHYISRTGQIDFWDSLPYPQQNPIQSIDYMVRQVVNTRKAFQTPDLGWFGREIHNFNYPNYKRDATWNEWQYICIASLKYNIPLGIRTRYVDFITDPLKDSIIVLLKKTIMARKSLDLVQ